MYNKNGLKYFMHITTINNQNNFMILPIDIRQLIWYSAHIYPVIQCFICDKVLINFSINVDDIENTSENYTIINGITKCNKCNID